MIPEEIHSSLDKMLENPKSRNFLNHLVRSYFPVSNVEKVWDKPTGEFKCILTKQSLISVGEIFAEMQTEEYKTNFMNHLKSMLDEKANKENPISKLIGDRKLGFQGKETNTFMCVDAFQAFYDWVITQSLKGNKHINWLIGSIRRESFIDRAENINDEVVQKKVQAIKKPIAATGYKLGETSDVLSKLKAKLEKDEL